MWSIWLCRQSCLYSRILWAVSDISLLDGLCILYLIPNSETQTSHLGISHKAKPLCSLEMLNADLLFMCEQINSPESCCLEHGAHSLPLQLCGVGWDHPCHRASSVCSPAAGESPRQPGRGREGMHGGPRTVGFVLIKLVQLQALGFVALGWSSSAEAIPKHSLTCLKRVWAAAYPSVRKTEK